MSLRQIATINRPFQSDNRLYASFFVEKWLREGKTMRLYLSLYESGNDIPFAVFSLEKAPNNPQIVVLLNEDRDLLGAYTKTDSALSIIEEIAKYVNVEEAFKLEVEEEEVSEQ
jgi:hypothetical protein